MKSQLYNLYRECFPEDSENYSIYYLRNKYNGKNCEYIEENGIIKSMLFMLPTKLAVGQKVLDCPFISGVGTRKSERGRGLARKNILGAFSKMLAEGKIVTTLYPERHKFYERLGFVTYAFSEKIAIAKIEEEGTALDVVDARAVLELYLDFAEKNAYVYCKRDLEFMEKRIDEFLTEGRVVGYFEDGELKAYAMYFDESDVDEVIFESAEYAHKLGITNYRKASNLGREEGMIRVLDAKRFFEEIEYHEEFVVDWKVKLVDEQIERNNFIMRFVVKDKTGSVEILEEGTEFDFEYTVADLTSTITRCGINLTLEKF